MKGIKATDYVYRGSIDILKDTEAAFTITGITSDGHKYKDGEYVLEIHVEDSVGNSSDSVVTDLRLDTTIERPSLKVGQNRLSPTNQDKKFRETSIDITVNESLTITGYIGTADNQRYIEFINSHIGETNIPLTKTWDGRDLYGNIIREGDYCVHLEAADEAGNKEIFTYEEMPIVINNTLPIILGTALHGDEILFVNKEINYEFELSKKSYIEFSIIDENGNMAFRAVKDDVLGKNVVRWLPGEDIKRGFYQIIIEAWDEFGNHADPLMIYNELR
jgi:hypothetical protein